MLNKILEEAKFLIVDDQLDNIELLEKILKRAGYQHFISITDPRKFFDKYNEFPPDIILLDLHMPGIDGFDLLEALQARLNKDDYLPVLILSADITPESKRIALAAGAKDFINKPFDRTEVLLRIKNLLEARFLHLKIVEQNLELEQKVIERTEKLEMAKLEILTCLAKAAEYRDDDTGEHTRRVGIISTKVAISLGLGPRECEIIRIAAPLHDVGKIGISDTLLLKRGKLGPEEFNIMKMHTIIGKEILSNSNFPVFQMAEKIAVSHHECWDGSGYPYGLKAEEIPIEGQIVSIADVFDALTHQRPYKEAWTLGEAIEEIIKQKGKKFHPEVVNSFLKIVEELRFIE